MSLDHTRTAAANGHGAASGESVDLVCFSHPRWDFVYQRPQHLMSRAARGVRMLNLDDNDTVAAMARLSAAVESQAESAPEPAPVRAAAKAPQPALQGNGKGVTPPEPEAGGEETDGVDG